MRAMRFQPNLGRDARAENMNVCAVIDFEFAAPWIASQTLAMTLMHRGCSLTVESDAKRTRAASYPRARAIAPATTCIATPAIQASRTR